MMTCQKASGNGAATSHSTSHSASHSTTSCGYSCAVGGMQKVKSIGTSNEADQKHCSMKCCMTKGCVAFNYDTKSKACSLSGSSFAQSHPVAGPKTMMTCQKASGDAPEVEYSNAVEDVLAEDE